MRIRTINKLILALGCLFSFSANAQIIDAVDDHFTIVQNQQPGGNCTTLPVGQNDIFLPAPRLGGLRLLADSTSVAVLSTDSIFNVTYCVLDTSFFGVDSFEYEICDSIPVFGQVCDTAKVYLFVFRNFPITGTVWPGDANSDGVTNIFDILPIGLNAFRNGPPRNVQGNQYAPLNAPLWNDTIFNGANLHHVDCDGNGVINIRDTIAVDLNYGLNHPKTDGPEGDCRIDPPLWVEVIGPSVLQSGDTVELRVNLGDNAIPANITYGAALEIEYNLPVIDSVVKRNMSNSWLLGFPGGTGPGFSFLKHLPMEQRIDVAITRNGGLPAIAGSGEIGSIIIIIDDNLSGKAAGIEDLIFSIGDGMAMGGSGQSYEICKRGDTASVNITTSINSPQVNDNRVRLIPNPATESVKVSWEDEACDLIEMVDINGRVIFRSNIGAGGTKEKEIDVSEFAPGFYLIKVSGPLSFETKRLLINR